jgi:Leucine-rich repeat (LRR) protein
MFTFISTASLLQAETLELCTAIDGSGSISSSDFHLQVEGLARAIKEPSIVPQNSRVTLSVVQFSSGVRVDVTPTLIDSQATADAVAAQVSAIYQMGGGTNISGAIDACTQQFGFTTDKQVIDVSTDGESSGSSDASNRAIAAGVDVINALGVGSGINVDELRSMVRPQPASEFPEKGFVYVTPGFNEYAKAIKAKMAAETGQLLAVECTQIPQTECKGLVELYFRTKGYYWEESWSAEQTHCEWKGITCQDGHVTQIDLSGNKLRGTIPESMGYYFSKLSSLNLAYNRLSGSIPSSLGHLSQLQTLALNNNQFNGSIPSSIGNIKPLETLNLNDNQLSGFIPKSLEKLQKLQRFDISNNQFTGMFPAFLNNLNQPVSFDLSGNQIIVGTAICPNVAEIPQSECNALVHLYNNTDGKNWRYNTGWNMTNAPCGWKGVSCSDGHVTKIELVDNQLKGYIPESIGNLGNLTELNLGSNKLSGPIPESIGKLGKLTKLYLRWNQLSGPIPESIGNLGNLTGLYLWNNQLSGPIPESIGNLGNLTGLNLGSNKLSGPIPESIGNLGKLTWLNLIWNQLSGPIPESIGNLGNLTELDLRWNQLSGPIPESIGNLDNLSSLYVSGNKFSCDEIPSSLNPDDCPVDKMSTTTLITIGSAAIAIIGLAFLFLL